jgi:Ca2+-dependent lipid-binding protein
VFLLYSVRKVFVREMAAAQVAANGIAGALKSGGTTETVAFLNDLVAQMWTYLNVAGCQMIKDVVEPSFLELPGPLKTLHFVKLDLGTVPFEFDRVDVQTVEHHTIKLDIEMDGDYLPAVGIAGCQLSGRVSVLLCPLISKLPLIAAQQVALINPPEIDLKFTGAAYFAELSFVDEAIRGIIGSIIGGMMVLPNRMFIRLDPLCSIFQAYLRPVGMIRVKIERGDGFKTTGTVMQDIPDMQCAVTFGASDVWKTSIISNDNSPEWNEEHDFILSDFQQAIQVRALESDTLTTEDIGLGSIVVTDLLSGGGKQTLKLIGKDKAETGASVTLSCRIFDLVPDASALHNQSADSASESSASKDTFCGLLTILIAGAKYLPGARDTINVMAKTTFGDKKFQTASVTDVPGIDPNNPSFDATYSIPLTSTMVKEAPDITFQVLNHDAVMGDFKVPFAHILQVPQLTLENEHILPDGGTFLTKTMLSGMVPHM